MITPTLPLAPSKQNAPAETKAPNSQLLAEKSKMPGSAEASFQDHLNEPMKVRTPGAGSEKPSNSTKSARRPDSTNNPKQGNDPRNSKLAGLTAQDQGISSKGNPVPPRDQSRPALPKDSSKATAPTSKAASNRNPAPVKSDLNARAARPESSSSGPSALETNTASKVAAPATESKETPAADQTQDAQNSAPSESKGKEKEANPADLAKESGKAEDDRARLEAILALAGFQMPSLVDLPSISVLTGRLENITPSDIPSTITQSPLIQNFVGSADPATLVDQVKPLGEWLSDMGWTPDGLAVQDQAAFQDLMATPISLRNLMQSLNVDVDRVVKEAQILQTTLPLDGVAPYMARAQRLQEQGPVRQAATQQGEKNPDAMLFVMAAMGHAIAQQEGALASNSIPASKTADPRIEGASSLPDSESLWISTAELPEGTMIPLSVAQDLPQVVLPKMASDNLATLPTSQPFATGPAMMFATPTQAFQAQDPLAFMKQQNAGLVQTFNFQPQAEVLARPDVQSPVSMDLMQSLQAIQIQQDPKDQPKRESLMESLMAFAAAPEAAIESAFAADSEKSDSQSFDDSNEGSFDGVQHAPTHQSNGPSSAFNVETSPEVAKSTLPPAVMKEVFDKSSLLLKEGGGSMRIDLGSKELGSVNLAVEVKDKTVEIRILAPTSHARELLATELPKLREALQNQNLDLKKVEIGLGGGSSFSQTSSDGRSSSRRDEYQNFEDSSIRGVGGSQRMSRGYRQVTQVSSEEAPRINHDGAIQVRV